MRHRHIYSITGKQWLKMDLLETIVHPAFYLSQSIKPKIYLDVCFKGSDKTQGTLISARIVRFNFRLQIFIEAPDSKHYSVTHSNTKDISDPMSPLCDFFGVSQLSDQPVCLSYGPCY